MKKVFIVHGFRTKPNAGWRSWLMSELSTLGIFACALAMPSPDSPQCGEWVKEIARYVERDKGDEIYLVGHSLGVPTILRYLETVPKNLKISGAVLVSGPCEKFGAEKTDNFFNKDFNFELIKSKSNKFVVIHGDNDTNVPLSNAKNISKELGAELIIVKNGGHLNGSSGWHKLPQVLNALNKMFSYN